MKVDDKETLVYHKRISQAMDFIQHHINQTPAEGLNLEAIAQAACLSEFHFHKVFKVVVGETVADYIRRLKLEKSLGIFFYYKQTSITEVAMALGFSSSQNLAKAFKKQFKYTPSDIKSLTSIEQLKSIIGQYRKDGNALEISTLYSQVSSSDCLDTDFMTSQNSNTLLDGTRPLDEGLLSLTVAALPERNVIFKRLIGEYGNGVQEASMELQSFANENKLATGDPVLINWDNPKITPSEKCRTDICLTLLGKCDNAAPYHTQLIEAGHYAVMRGQLSQDHQYEQAWQKLFEQIFAKGYELKDKPCFKVMHIQSSQPQQGIFDVSFCAAIEAPQPC